MFYGLNDRRIAKKSTAWDRIKRGELMKVTFDLEASGTDRSNVPYATPNYAYITEYGDALSDFAGNYLNSAQIFAKAPEWVMYQPIAPIMQRAPNLGPDLFDEEGRMPYWDAMASITWRIERAAYAYSQLAEQYGDRVYRPEIIDFNKQLRRGSTPGQIEASPKTIDIPLLDDEGNVVWDVRYHPDLGKLSYRFDSDASSDYFRGEDNLFYEDTKDRSLWKWVDVTVGLRHFNGKNFDIPLIRSNMFRTGSSPQDSTFLYARATASDKQRPKNHSVDVRDKLLMAIKYGPQGEDGLKIGEVVDPNTGLVRPSEALSAFLAKNQRHANPVRMIGKGAYMPHEQEWFDAAQAHGAHIDSLGTLAAENLAEDVAPEICAIHERQADEAQIVRTLTKKPDNEDYRLPLHCLPRKEAGKYHDDLPYYFLNTDDQIGRFKKLIFLKTDGSLHTAEYNGKLYKDLTPEEWLDLLQSAEVKGNPDTPVRTESIRRWPGAISVRDVLQKTSQGKRYRAKIEDMAADVNYIIENPAMQNNLLTAMEELNRRQRYSQHSPAVPLIEDDLLALFSGEVHYLDAERDYLERLSDGRGPRKLPAVLETVHNDMNKIYQRYMRGIDEALGRLIIKAHKIDAFRDTPIDATPHIFEEHPEQTDEERNLGRKKAQDVNRVLENFRNIAENIYATMKKKRWPYLSILEEIENPATGEPYFQKGKFKAATVREAFEFRRLLGLRALNDFQRLLQRKQSSYIDGYVDKHFASHTAGKSKLLLFADADSGEKGAPPHIVDKHGREIEVDYIKAQKLKYVLQKIESGAWSYRFYRMGSEPSLMRLLHRFVDIGLEDQIPEDLQTLYQADKRNRLLGMPNEDANTSRIPTIGTAKRDIKMLKQNAAEAVGLLERPNNADTGAAAKFLGHEEGARYLGMINAHVNKKAKEVGDSADIIEIGRHDPETDLPYDYIPYCIDRDSNQPFEKDPNFAVIDVPIWHLRKPIEQFDPDLPPQMIAVPKISKKLRDAIHKQHKKVILRERETGRLYHTGPASVHAMPREGDNKFAEISRKVRHDYEQAGKTVKHDNLSLLGIEDLYPVANTRDVNPDFQTFKIPKTHFDGLFCPQFAGVGDKPLTSIIIPVNYCPQIVEPGKAVRFREMDSHMFGNITGETYPDTGHTVETRIKPDGVIGLDENGRRAGITLRQLFKAIESGDIDPKVIQGAGTLGPEHIKAHLNAWAMDKYKSNPLSQRVLVISFDEVNKTFRDKGLQDSNKWAYAHLLTPPQAAIMRKGEKLVSPRTYK